MNKTVFLKKKAHFLGIKQLTSGRALKVGKNSLWSWQNKFWHLLNFQTELRRVNFNGFHDMSLAFRAKDVEGVGRLPKEQVRLTLIAGCSSAKSKLRAQNVNHIINSIFKRFYFYFHLFFLFDYFIYSSNHHWLILGDTKSTPCPC